MNLKSGMKTGITFLMGLMPVFVLLACVSSNSSTVGSPAGPTSRADLERSGKNTGTWKGEYLTLVYTTTGSAGKFRISGQGQLDEYFVIMEMRIRYLYVNMHFLDRDGVIMESHLISSTGLHTADRDIFFSKEVTLPPNAAGLAFSYTGMAREPDGGLEPFGSPPPALIRHLTSRF